VNGQEEAFVGVAIVGRSLVAVEVQPDGDKPMVNRLTTLHLERGLDFSTISENGAREALVSALKTLTEGHSGSLRAALAISDRLALVKCLPVDRGMSKEELADQVRWEVDHLLVADRNDYRVDSSYVALGQGSQDRLVVVAIRKAFVELIKEVAQKAGLRLTALDLDVFAGVRAVRHNHQLARGSTAAVLRLLPTVASLALLREGELCELQELPLPESSELAANRWDDSLARELGQWLERQNGNGQPERLLLYGAFPEGFAALVRQHCPMHVEVVNAFQRLGLSPEVARAHPPAAGHEVVAATGAALRGVAR
jgi:Tfp pilus assembly PilM family ATPase